MMHRATCVSFKGSTTGSFHESTRSFRAGYGTSAKVTEVTRVHGRPPVLPVFVFRPHRGTSFKFHGRLLRGSTSK